MEPYELVPLDPFGVADHPDNDYDVSTEAVARLARSIELDGLAQPPLVRELPDGTYQAVAGHRRLAAVRMLAEEHPGEPRWRTVPCLVARGMDDRRARILLDVTNLETRDLTAAERAQRTAALAELVPERRASDPSLRGVRTTEVIARMLREAGVTHATEAQVRGLMQREAARGRAVAACEALRGGAAAIARAEAEAGRLDEATVSRVARLDEDAQLEVATSAQRAGGGRAAWRRAADEAEGTAMPALEAQSLAEAAARAMERLLPAVRRGVPVGEARVARLQELAAELARQVEAHR